MNVDRTPIPATLLEKNRKEGLCVVDDRAGLVHQH